MTIVLLLFLGLLGVSFCSHVYYILTSDVSNSTCPHEGDTCHTLSYYATLPWLYFQSNATFIFMAGNHHLTHNIKVFQIHNLTLKGEGIK